MKRANSRIRIMPPDLAIKIAAGEVVERPSSVVKELVENSIDAGATEVSVFVERGGVAGIKVIDNGEGMSSSDARLAFERHATSKVKEEGDLYSISTMGFRGEALPSIASVSRVTLKTKVRGELSGTMVRVDGGKVEEAVECGCADGTSVEVRDIFYNTPVRKKFLRSPVTEFGRIKDVVERLALSHEDIRFRLLHGRNLVVDCPVSSLRERVNHIVACDGKSCPREIASREGNITVKGYITAPDVSSATSKGIHIFLNRRWVRDKGVMRSIMEGYRNVLMDGRFPLAVIYLEAPGNEVDVNVHPAKSEVKFISPGAVYNSVRQAVKGALAAHAGSSSVRSPIPYEQEVREGEGAYSGIKNSPVDQYGMDYTPTTQHGSVKNPLFLDLSVIGQLWGEFLLCAGEEEFYLIDQHGASERIAFERLKERYRDRAALGSQLMLVPETVELSDREREVMESVRPYLDRLGFTVEPFGGSTYLIKAVPQELSGVNLKPVLKDLIDEMLEISLSSRFEESVDDILKRIACHSVIRGARMMTVEEAKVLLKDMAVTEFSFNCPHGRPVVKVLSRSEVERFFKRI